MIRFSFEPGNRRRDDFEDMHFAARPLVRGLVAAALERAQRRQGRPREPEDAFEAGTRIDVHVDADELVEAIRSAAVDGLQHFIAGLEDGLKAMAERHSGPDAAGPGAKAAGKPRSKSRVKPTRKRRATASTAASA